MCGEVGMRFTSTSWTERDQSRPAVHASIASPTTNMIAAIAEYSRNFHFDRRQNDAVELSTIAALPAAPRGERYAVSCPWPRTKKTHVIVGLAASRSSWN
jgi:hypothetical protein